MQDPWSENEADQFLEAAQSLKLYRRAELFDEEKEEPLIEKLYVDPLPNHQILKALLRSNTTVIVGRKGTGKSTIFQRAQHEIRKKKSIASAYIDIKTLYESSEIDPLLAQRINSSQAAMPARDVRRLLLYRSFISSILQELRLELKKQLNRSFLDRIKNRLFATVDDFLKSLDDLLAEAQRNAPTDITALTMLSSDDHAQASKSADLTWTIAASCAAAPSVDTSLSTSQTANLETGTRATYSSILIHTFNINAFIVKVAQTLQSIGIRHLYLFIDDFSELPSDAMKVVVDTLLSPLNNWSNEFFKFKIAAYPGRIYYGQIDKTKIDEIYLDIYKLYGASDVSTMEEKAIDFTRRLVEGRLKHYCGMSAASFFEIRDEEEFWRVLFYSTMANPRNLGYLMYYLHESNLIYGKTIGIRAIRDAARKYYEEKIEPYFSMHRFVHQSFDERSSVFSLKELLERIVERARELRRHSDVRLGGDRKGIASAMVFKDLAGRLPTSHFYVVVELESLLSSLELNFFLTKYYEMSDRDGRKASVIALNYGLCEKYGIEFGRPLGKREFRLYFVERAFNYSHILRKYIQENQEIKCENCHATFDSDYLDSLRLYGMRCPKCPEGVVKVSNLSRKYEAILRSVSNDLLLPESELGIIQTLENEGRPMFAAEIAGELDCSYQLVGKRGKILEQQGLVERIMEKHRRKFQVTEVASSTYFQLDAGRELDV